MIFNKKRETEPEDTYPGIRNIRKRRKADCINYFYHEMPVIDKSKHEKLSMERSESLKQWLNRKMDLLVENSMEFFEDKEINYTEERKNG